MKPSTLKLAAVFIVTAVAGLCVGLLLSNLRTEWRPAGDGRTIVNVRTGELIDIASGRPVTELDNEKSEQAREEQKRVRVATVQVTAISYLLEEFHIDVGSYPTTRQGLASLRTAPGDLADATRWFGPYSSKDIEPDPWGRAYLYESQGDGYRVWSLGADGLDGTQDDISNP